MAVEEINRRIAETPQYRKWVDSPSNKTRGHVGDCLDPLKAKRHNKDLAWLTRHIQVTLFCAKRYTPKDDRFVENADERIKNMKSQLKSISKFRKLAEKDPGFELRFFLEACYPFNIPDEDRHALILKTGFSNYEESLKKDIKWIRESQKRMLIARGGLLYKQFDEDGKRVPIRDIKFNSIYFHLTYIFHHFTAGKLDLGTTVKKMPRFGEPRFDLTAKILRNSLDSHSIRNRVDRLEAKDVYIGHWPTPR